MYACSRLDRASLVLNRTRVLLHLHGRTIVHHHFDVTTNQGSKMTSSTFDVDTEKCTSTD